MLEDINLMRGLPNMTVISTSDDTETRALVKEIAEYNGPVYLRLSRLKTPIIYTEDQKFKIGNGIQIGKGTDATVFATGVTVTEALQAQEELKEEGLDIRVVDIHTIKPIDAELIEKCARETSILISVEDHNIIGGLGSAISEVLTDRYPKKLERLGIHDTFGKSGKPENLMSYFHIDSESIKDIIKEKLYVK